MHQHTKVSDAHIENLTNLAGVKALDLSQDECLTLVYRQAVHAAANQLADFIRENQPFQIGGGASPVAFGVKAGLEHLIDGVHAIVDHRSTTALQRLSMQDSKQPRPNLRPPFEAVQLF